jgi:ElaB/YqjD/DUF883 family membrane-anchored ribosome-binding protein
MANAADKVTNVIDDAADKTQDAVRSGSEYARQAVDRTNGAVKRATEAVTDQAQRGANRASEWVDQAAGHVKDAADFVDDVTSRATERASTVAADVARRTQEQPITALLVAGALGYALAYLFHGKR